MEPTNPEDLLEEQLSFYRDGVPSYELWLAEVFDRGGGGAFGEVCRRDRNHALHDLEALAPHGHALELAIGPGTYTEALLNSASSVTGVDASPESLAAARSKLASFAGRINLVEADIFHWRPNRRYDTVFFSYWLSHVPPSRFEFFWELVADALTPNGRVFFIDSNGTHSNPSLRVRDHLKYSELDDLEKQVSTRELDGRIYRVVKVVWRPSDLKSRLADLGWDTWLAEGELSFWGRAARSGASA